MEDDNNILFVRGTAKSTNFNDADDVWDDTALIKAYDKAVNLAKDEVAKRIGMDIESESSDSSKQRKSNSSAKACRKWTVGAPCRARYSDDGEIYEAIITKIYENTGTCIVTFVGYGNTEKVELSKLRESGGLKSQTEQRRNCSHSEDNRENLPKVNSSFDTGACSNGLMGEGMDYESELPRMPKNVFNPGSTFNSSYGIMPPAPPLPPQLMAKLPDNDADALSSMLMSWYISGFHTGYYHGIKQARNLEEKRKK